MSSSVIAKVSVACISLMLLASCANTIRGMGKDTASTVNATQNAGHTVKKAATN
ncbi:MAG: entericidin [Rhizobium sp.]